MRQEKSEIIKEKSLHLLKELQVSLERGQTEAYHELNRLLAKRIADLEKRSGLAAAVCFSELIGLIKKHLSEYQMVLLPSEQEMLLELSDLKGQLNSASQPGFMF